MSEAENARCVYYWLCLTMLEPGAEVVAEEEEYACRAYHRAHRTMQGPIEDNLRQTSALFGELGERALPVGPDQATLGCRIRIAMRDSDRLMRYLHGEVRLAILEWRAGH